jgi:hypothetical protein
MLRNALVQGFFVGFGLKSRVNLSMANSKMGAKAAIFEAV